MPLAWIGHENEHVWKDERSISQVPPGFDSPPPKRPSDVTRIDLARQQDMGNLHVLLTRLKGV